MSDFKYQYKYKITEDQKSQLWKIKSDARLMILEKTRELFSEHSNLEAISNAFCELFENSIKYSKESSEAEIGIEITDNDITIYSQNISDNKDILEEFIAEIEISEKNYEEQYLEKLKTINISNGQLGILRVLMETKGVIAFVKNTSKDLVYLTLRFKL